VTPCPDVSKGLYAFLIRSEAREEETFGSRFQTSAAKWMRTALFWVVTQRVVVISYRPFGTSCSLRDNPEALSSQTFCSFTLSETTNPEIEPRVTEYSTLEQYRCDNLKSSRHSLLRLLYGCQPFVPMKGKLCVMYGLTKHKFYIFDSRVLLVH